MTTTNTAAARIATVEFTNLKGQTASHALPELAAIVAPNGSGKTSVSDAIQLALTGCHPDLGKQGKSIMDMASGPLLEVGLTLTDGTRVRRGWKMDAKGSVKSTNELPESWPADDLALAFNPRTFVAMNDRDRVAELLRLAGRTAPTVAAVEALRDTLEEKASGASRVTISELDPFGPKMTDAGTFIEAAEAELVESRKAHKRDITRLEAAVKGLEDAARGAEAPVKVEAATVEELAAEVQKLATDGSRVGERHRAAVAQRRRVAEIGDAGQWSEDDDAELVRTIEELKRVQGHAADEATDRAALRACLARGPEPEEVAEANEVLAQPAITPPGQPLADATAAALANAERQTAIKRGELPNTEAEIARLQEQLAQECCPSCGATGEDLHSRLKATLQPYLDAAEAKRGALLVEVHSLEAEAVELSEVLAWWAAIEQHDKEVTKARAVLELDEEVETEAANIRALIADRAEAMAEAGEAPSVEELQAKLDAMQGRFANAKALKDLGDIPTEADVEALVKVIAEIEHNRGAKEAALREAKEGLRVWQEFGAQETHTTRMREELETARTKLATVEELVTATRAAGAALAAEIAAPLGEGLRYFTDGVLPGAVRVSPSLEIFLETEGRGLRRFGVLSGSEKAVVGFALAAFLATFTPLRVAVLDEASTMDTDRKAAFLARVAEAVAEGKLAQAVVIDHAAADYGTPWGKVVIK